MINNSFLKAYEETGTEYLFSEEFWSKYNIPVKQAQFDKKYLYGILVASNRSRDNQAIIRNQKAQDGIATWIAFKKSYAHDGSIELKLERLEESVSKPFSSNDPGGMVKYIDSFQANMENIDALDENAFNDKRKKRLLLMNVRHVSNIAHLVQKCRDDPSMTFEEAAAYLRSNAILIDHLAKSKLQQPKPSSMLKVETSDEDNGLNLKEAVALVKQMAAETSYHQVYNVLNSPIVRQSLRIPFPIWKKLEPKIQEKIEAIRKEVMEEERQNPHTKNHNSVTRGKRPSSKEEEEILPPQYPNKANFASQESVEEESEGEDSEDDEALHGFMARTERDEDLEIRAHFEYAELYKDSPKIFAISDGGADSCVLGKHAHVIHETGRHATLVGYDPKSTWSKKFQL